MSLGRRIDHISFNQGQISQRQRQIVAEYPLRLKINGAEFATLICSPHQLNFLLLGFCFQQGLIDSLADMLCLGVCQDAGLAEVRLRRTPPTAPPTLTSGCGGGLTYGPLEVSELSQLNHYSSLELQRLQKQLQRQAEHYQAHGGIHCAAVGDASGLILFAEDIGRHNCIDRLVGEALFRQIDLSGKMLVTSGRISVEMALKAARAGIGLIASRTAATDQALTVCARAGIVLIAYLRSTYGEVYTHQQRFLLKPEAPADPEAGT